ncbi:DUF5937 family protein [Streptomyces sp. NPDC087420]|uniref:DUF5937 family protein n=1 Tax=Streptomyces sp. NPDC087420 TaxID=3365785 RepID=UPI0038360392
MRFHVTGEDLGRIRVMAEPDVSWEMLLAAHMAQSPEVPPSLRRWRAASRARLTAPVRRLLALAPARGYSPDFLTPAEGAEGLAPVLETVRSLPRARLRGQLRQLDRTRRSLHWTGVLGEGGRHALTGLAEGMAAFHHSFVAPYWSQIRAHVAAGHARGERALREGGTDRLLETLHPGVTWDPPVLELTGLRFDRDVRLGGRGLRLVPSYFCWGAPTVLRDPRLPPVLVYPVARDPARLLRVDQGAGPGTGTAGGPALWEGPPAHLADVLDSLLAGRTDDAAAVLLGISSRSYSRRVRELLAELDVTTRFQAGAAAARRGWI